jgi:hypothetical protein
LFLIRGQKHRGRSLIFGDAGRELNGSLINPSDLHADGVRHHLRVGAAAIFD